MANGALSQQHSRVWPLWAGPGQPGGKVENHRGPWWLVPTVSAAQGIRGWRLPRCLASVNLGTLLSLSVLASSRV